MKRTLIIIILLFIISLFVHVPKYIELNDLIIIDKININCSNKTIIYREIIPYKDNNSISYKYKNYKYSYNEVNKFFNKKNIYYQKAKIRFKNCK